MKKVKVFLNVLLNSIIPWPSYYSKILHMKFGSSLKYLITLVFLLNIIFIASIYAKINYGKVSSVINGLLVSTKDIPKDINLEINNGKLLTNFSRPYFFWIDYAKGKKLIIVVDESANPEKIRQYRSLFLLTSTELVSYSQGSIDKVPLASLGKITINQVFINEAIKMFYNIGKMLPFIYLGLIILIALFIPAISFIIVIFYLLISSLIGYFAFRLFTKKYVKYKKTMQIAFHAATLPLIIDYFIIIFKPSLPIRTNFVIPENFFPVVFIFLLSLFIFTGIYEAYSKNKRDTMSA